MSTKAFASYGSKDPIIAPTVKGKLINELYDGRKVASRRPMVEAAPHDSKLFTATIEATNKLPAAFSATVDSAVIKYEIDPALVTGPMKKAFMKLNVTPSAQSAGVFSKMVAENYIMFGPTKSSTWNAEQIMTWQHANMNDEDLSMYGQYSGLASSTTVGAFTCPAAATDFLIDITGELAGKDIDPTLLDASTKISYNIKLNHLGAFMSQTVPEGGSAATLTINTCQLLVYYEELPAYKKDELAEAYAKGMEMTLIETNETAITSISGVTEINESLNTTANVAMLHVQLQDVSAYVNDSALTNIAPTSLALRDAGKQSIFLSSGSDYVHPCLYWTDMSHKFNSRFLKSTNNILIPLCDDPAATMQYQVFTGGYNMVGTERLWITSSSANTDAIKVYVYYYAKLQIRGGRFSKITQLSP